MALGIAAFVSFDSLDSGRAARIALLAAVLAAVCGVFVWALLKRKPVFLILSFCFVIGAARASLSTPPSVELNSCEVSAIVYEIPEKEGGSYTLCSVKLDGEPYPGKLRLKLKSESDELRIGDEVRFVGSVKTSNVRFGAYNERLELLSKGVTAKAVSENVDVISSGAIPIKRCLSYTRSFLNERIDNIFGENAGIVSGFLLGDKTGVDGSDLDSFRATGTAHLLSLSGFHVGLLAGIFFFLLPKRRPVLRFIVIGSFLLLYCAVASFASSIVRATVMCMCMLLSDVTERRRDSLSAISLSALIILLFSPYMIFSIGFGLSFAATLGIIFILSAGSPSFRSPAVNKIVSSLLITIGASAATAMISARYFNTFPTYGIIANLIAVPLFSVIITVCFILLVLGVFFPQAAALLAWAPNRMIDGSMMLLNGISSLPYSTFQVGSPSVLSCVLMLVLMFSISAYVLRPMRKRIKIFLCVLLLFTASVAADIIRA